MVHVQRLLRPILKTIANYHKEIAPQPQRQGLRVSGPGVKPEDGSGMAKIWSAKLDQTVGKDPDGITPGPMKTVGVTTGKMVERSHLQNGMVRNLTLLFTSVR